MFNHQLVGQNYGNLRVVYAEGRGTHGTVNGSHLLISFSIPFVNQIVKMNMQGVKAYTCLSSII